MSRRFFQGKYYPKNPQKYRVQKNIDKIRFRSSWEKAVMIWLDKNQDVKIWDSEEVVVPYISKIDGNYHKYFIDFFIEFISGKRLLVEVKPYCQTQQPKPRGKKKEKTYINEVITYATNQSKWAAAQIFAEANDCKFIVWTEKTLNRLGININAARSFRKKRNVNTKK